MEKINGIIISGKVYELVPTRKDQRCADSCALNELCSTKLARRGHQPCMIYDTPDNTHKYGEHHFRYSPELTERLNNPDSPKWQVSMTEERYQYLNSLSIEDYDNQTSYQEQKNFCEYQQSNHPEDVIYLQCANIDNDE